MLFLRKTPPADEGEREKQLKEFIQQGNDVVRDEDFVTAFATQRGLGSAAYEGFLYGHNERGSQYFHEWVNWYLQGNASLPTPVL